VAVGKGVRSPSPPLITAIKVQEAFPLDYMSVPHPNSGFPPFFRNLAWELRIIDVGELKWMRC
jgi:hypothetical protein